MRFSSWAFILALALGVSQAFSQEGSTWKLDPDGQWSRIHTPTTAPTSQAVDEPVLDRAERLLYQKEDGRARDLLLDWEKANKKNPARDRCIFLLAEGFYQKGERIKAFYYLDEVMDEYPSSSFFTAALEKQFSIAYDYLHGYRERFLWMPILDRSDDGVEMMFRIQQRSPGSPLAERALLETADYYFSDQQYDVAQDAYTSYVRSYPRSDQVPRVRLRAAFSSLAQFRGVLFDPTSIIDARAQLIDIEKTYPELAKEENVPSVIEQIDDAFAKKLLEMGRYYEKVHEVKGAVFEYRFLTQTYPNSTEAATARARLRKLPASVLVDPAPPFASGYAPAATEPAVINDVRP